MMQTALHRNPFWLLGATTRDDRRRIVELAEAKLLEVDHAIYQKARSELTNPRTRLKAELAWLPGVSPAQAIDLVRNLTDRKLIRVDRVLPPLAHANLLAAAFEAVEWSEHADALPQSIEEMISIVDSLSATQILRDINEDRIVSGFPEVSGTDFIESGLAERKRYFPTAMKTALDALPSAALVEVMTTLVHDATKDGERHAPELLDELVDAYEIEAQAFLETEAENAAKLVAAVRGTTARGGHYVDPLIDKLEAVARNWDSVAQPIQLSFKARGQDHQPSKALANAIRSLAVDLYNEHDMLEQSQRLTHLLQELFAEVPDVAERVDEDVETLEEIHYQQREAEARVAEWAREITFSAEVGVVFKNTLSISPDGVTWSGHSYALDAITRISWGGTRHSVNGIPTGTTYTISFGDARSQAVVELRRGEVFETFVEKLFRAVGIRLLTELLASLRSGEEVEIGDAAVSDGGVRLPKHKLFGKREYVQRQWHQTQVWSADGSFFIGAKDDKKAYAALSYIHVFNTHILERAIRMAFKMGAARLSDVLRSR